MISPEVIKKAEEASKTWHTLMPNLPVTFHQFTLWIHLNDLDITMFGIGRAFRKSLTTPEIPTKELLAYASGCMIKAKKSRIQRKETTHEATEITEKA